jgi:acyl-CoA synthetase (AMP-forming)/AMP-acid ligase II
MTDWTLRQDPSGFRIRWSQTAAQRYKESGYWRESTLVDIARVGVLEDPQRVLLIEGDRRLTRTQAWQQALQLAAFFLGRGLRPGDVISFQLPNWAETAVIALAARMCGLIINPIPPIYREAELAYILKDCGSKMIFVPQVFRKHDYYALITRVRTQLPALRDVITVRGTSPLEWSQVLSAATPDEKHLPQVDPAAVMMVMYTSGTTGSPKGVLHTHYGYDYRVLTMGAAWGVGAADVVFMPSPVTHITGAYWVFDMPWIRNCVSVLMDVWTPDAAIECIERNGCTISGGATPFLQQLLEVGSARPQALESLRLFFCGGTTVSPDLVKAAGHAFVPDGTEGEIVVRGPEQFVGYFHSDDNKGNFDEQGFFRMGDLGRRVHDHYLVITGRKKDIIIRSGENLSPKEVEDVLFGHPGILEVAIVAMPSALTGEKGCAFVIPRGGAHIDLAEIRRFLETAGLARQKFPEHLVLVEDLPRVPSGKVRKDLLRQHAQAIAEAQPG